jgi:hypothetical protein
MADPQEWFAMKPWHPKLTTQSFVNLSNYSWVNTKLFTAPQCPARCLQSSWEVLLGRFRGIDHGRYIDAPRDIVHTSFDGVFLIGTKLTACSENIPLWRWSDVSTIWRIVNCQLCSLSCGTIPQAMKFICHTLSHLLHYMTLNPPTAQNENSSKLSLSLAWVLLCFKNICGNTFFLPRYHLPQVELLNKLRCIKHRAWDDQLCGIWRCAGCGQQ